MTLVDININIKVFLKFHISKILYKEKENDNNRSAHVSLVEIFLSSSRGNKCS